MLLLVLTAAPEAHPTANAFDIIRVPGDGRIDVEITAHAESLVLTLAGLAKGSAPAVSPGTSSSSASAIDRVGALAPELLRLIDLDSDGSPVALKWLGVADTRDRQGLVTVHLEALSLRGAETIRWRASFMLSAYPIAVIGGSSSVAPDNYDWLAGMNEVAWALTRSRLMRVPAIGPPSRADGLHAHVPGGLDHVLFMLGLFLMAPRDERCCSR